MHECPSHHIFGKDPAATPGVSGSYPLVCHLLDTAVVAGHLWDEWLRTRLKDLLVEGLATVNGG